MNIRFSFLVLFSLLFFTDSFSQRIDNEKFDVQVNLLPVEPFPASYTTYSASVNASGEDMALAGYTASSLINRHFMLRSFNQLNSGGHFHIHVEIGRINVEKIEPIIKETTTENKDGEKVVSKEYYGKVFYRMPITLKVVDADGKIWSEILHGSPGKTLTHDFKDISGPYEKNFDSEKDMNTAWAQTEEETKNIIRKKTINEAFDEFGEKLKENYDVRPEGEKITLQTPKGKRINNADEFETKTNQAKEILMRLTAEGGITEAREAMQPILAFWETQKDNFSPDERREAKVHLACTNNLAVAHFYLENFEETRKWLAACAAVDFRAGATKQMTEDMEGIMARMALNNTTTRHFVIEKGSAEGPDNADYSAYTGSNTNTFIPLDSRVERREGFVITQSGDSLNGEFIFRGRNGLARPIFSEGGNVRFEYMFQGKEANRLLDPSWFLRAVFNGREFKSLSYRGPLAIRKKNHLVEVMTEDSKINLYKQYDFETTLDERSYGHDMVIQKPGGDYKNLAIDNLAFTNWKNAFGEFFKDCEKLYAEIQAGEYRRNDHNILKAVRAYNNNECE